MAKQRLTDMNQGRKTLGLQLLPLMNRQGGRSSLIIEKGAYQKFPYPWV